MITPLWNHRDCWFVTKENLANWSHRVTHRWVQCIVTTNIAFWRIIRRCHKENICSYKCNLVTPIWSPRHPCFVTPDRWRHNYVIWGSWCFGLKKSYFDHCCACDDRDALCREKDLRSKIDIKLLFCTIAFLIYTT